MLFADFVGARHILVFSKTQDLIDYLQVYS